MLMRTIEGEKALVFFFFKGSLSKDLAVFSLFDNLMTQVFDFSGTFRLPGREGLERRAGKPPLHVEKGRISTPCHIGLF